MAGRVRKTESGQVQQEERNAFMDRIADTVNDIIDELEVLRQTVDELSSAMGEGLGSEKAKS